MLTLKFKNTYINHWFTLAGDDERKGRLSNIDMYLKDFYYGEKTLEAAEVKMQKTVLNNLLSKTDFDLVIGGDLSNQLGTINTCMRDFPKSFLGIYNACSTFVEGLLLASNLIMNNNVDKICVLTSSHNLTSERQFRFPVEYGALKACYTTSTTTAAVGAIISNIPSKYKIVSATIGSVVDYGITDVYNMGAVMAPAAASAINAHLFNMNKRAKDYDIILTGDLGTLGIELLNEVLKRDFKISTDNIYDAGTMIYKESQNKYTGGSGPSVLPLVLFSKIIRQKRYKKILIVGTGALHNPTLINQKNSIPAIAHVVEIEVES